MFACLLACLLACLPKKPPGLFRMLLELIFIVLLRNVPYGSTDIFTPWAPVGAKNPLRNNKIINVPILLFEQIGLWTRVYYQA